MLNIKKIRKDFPQLKAGYHYLDAAASSLTPQQVLDAVSGYYRDYRANVHRALFTEAVTATEKYEEARNKVAGFVGANSREEVIFTSGATESSNMLVRMLEESGVLKKGGDPTAGTERASIVTTEMEHHGALVPLQQLAKRDKRELVYIPLRDFGLDSVAAEKLLTDKTSLVSVMLASNVTGTVNDVRLIADIARKHGALVVCDATAAAGHIPVDVRALGVDALYFSGHKMFGPTGIGVLWVAKRLLEKLEPSSFGGHMISSVSKEGAEWAPIPERFEAGTKNIGGVIGLGAAIDYLKKIGVENVHTHVRELTAYAISKLEKISGVRVLAEHDSAKNIGVVSFVCDFAHPHDIAEILARDNVAVRPGHHCAMPLHSALGVSATTRASFHVYNTKGDVDALIVSLEKARAIFSV